MTESLSHIISISDLNLQQIQTILHTAKQFKQQAPGSLLSNKIIANCFFEPSTRTRLSFAAAAARLGASVIGFTSGADSSIQKGESLQDSIKVISHYADLIVLRHEQEGAARLAQEVSAKPIINAGDGANQHPTQALIDLFSMAETQTRLDGLAIGFVGDLKYGRTIHSLVQLCALFTMRLFFVSPPALLLPDYLCDYLKYNKIRFSFHERISDILEKVDILYMTRLQKERFAADEYPLLKYKFILTADLLASVKPQLKVLHPLPRVDEIDRTVDSTQHAYYFEQAANGLYIRQALLALLLQ